MDTESLKSLGTLLFWGLLFFLMMRFGCGAHIMGGHGHHGGHGKADDTAEGQTKDPVCGMAVDRDKSTAASAYHGKTYHFCSASCRDKFEQAPEKYLGGAGQGEHQHGGHHHG
jgi:YHS domain-containing protein